MKRVLVIDDDPAVRSAYCLALEDCPYEVVAVGGGDEGLHHFAHSPFDLVFLDLRMPEMDGLETLRRLRALDPGVPVYIVSGFASELSHGLREIAREGPTVEIYEKPLSRMEIMELARAVLG